MPGDAPGRGVRCADRLRQASSPRRAQHDPHRALQIDAVPDRDEDRVHTVSRSDDARDHLPIVDEPRAGPAFGARLAVLSHQARLAATEGRKVELHAQVRRDTEAPWMGDSVPVDEEQAGFQPPRL